jgi:hypothetical protein
MRGGRRSIRPGGRVGQEAAAGGEVVYRFSFKESVRRLVWKGTVRGSSKEGRTTDETRTKDETECGIGRKRNANILFR